MSKNIYLLGCFREKVKRGAYIFRRCEREFDQRKIAASPYGLGKRSSQRRQKCFFI